MHDVPLRPSAALLAYAESYIQDRRVLVFGDSTSGLAEHLLDRGARLIHVYDPDPARVAQAATRNSERRVTIAALQEGALATREGAFDCALVEDLSQVPSRPNALRALRRALSPRGVALIAAPNPDAERRLMGGAKGSDELDYYGLYDAVSAELEHVRMLGQTPFVGYAVVDFAPDGQPEPSFDNAFVPGGAEEPEQYIALASMTDVRLDDMTIVQLPLARLGLGPAQDSALAAARQAERRALKRVASLEGELKRSAQSGDPSAVERLRVELDERDSWIRELESRASAADARADDAESELDTLRERLNQQASEATRVRELEDKLARAERKVTENPRVRELEDKLARAERKVTENPRVRELEKEKAALQADVTMLCDRLSEQEAAAEAAAEAGLDTERMASLTDELDELRRVAARTQREREWAEERVRRLQEELETVLRESEEAAESEAAEDDAALAQQRTQLQELEQRLAQQRATATAAEQSVQAARSDAEQARGQLTGTQAQLTDVKAQLAAAQAQLAGTQGQLTDVKAQLAEAQGRHANAESERTASQQADNEREAALSALREQLTRARAELHDERANGAAAELTYERELREKTERTLQQRDQALSILRKELVDLRSKLKATQDDPGMRGDLERLEAQLRERGQHVAELGGALRKLERHARGLAAEVQALTEGSSPAAADDERAALEAQVDHLAQVNAAREADLIAAGWAIAELRDRLADGVPAQVAVHGVDASSVEP